jgi:hypothetical protein
MNDTQGMHRMSDFSKAGVVNACRDAETAKKHQLVRSLCTDNLYLLQLCCLLSQFAHNTAIDSGTWRSYWQK